MITAIAVAVIRNGMILLVRNKDDMWTMPGGKMEEGESELECLVREMSEELPGAQLLDPEFFGADYGSFPSGERLELRIYTADLYGTTEVDSEIEESRWVVKPEELDVQGVTRRMIIRLREEGLL